MVPFGLIKSQIIGCKSSLPQFEKEVVRWRSCEEEHAVK
jgi:hypothetical protein